jgi:glycosyltransferase involved in cell wall biosynthesis
MMTVVVTIEQRYDRTPDGRIWAPLFQYSFWCRYLAVFEEVRVVARVRDVSAVPDDWRRADGDRVSFVALPYYLGPWQYLVRALKVMNAARNAIHPSDAVILRVDSQIAACMYPTLRRTTHPYGVEAVVDPYDVFSPGSFWHPLKWFFRWKFVRQMRQQCAGASAAAYVTKHALQTRYPPSPRAFSTYYSSVELSESAFVPGPRPLAETKKTFRVITVAALEDLRKGHDTLFDATARCLLNGLNVHLVLVGDGRNRRNLEACAARSGLGNRAEFRGQLNPAAVRAELDRADLFVLPSRGEGLPRAAIEAMARGLPVIGSTVSGFPELLPSEHLVPPGDPVHLAKKIGDVLTSPERMACMSARNLIKAREYHEEVLFKRRVEFYQHLKEITEAWQEQQKGHVIARTHSAALSTSSSAN